MENSESQVNRSLWKYHVSYYDPFPYLRIFHTSSIEDCFRILEEHGNVTVYISSFVRNCDVCNPK